MLARSLRTRRVSAPISRPARAQLRPAKCAVQPMVRAPMTARPHIPMVLSMVSQYRFFSTEAASAATEAAAAQAAATQAAAAQAAATQAAATEATATQAAATQAAATQAAATQAAATQAAATEATATQAAATQAAATEATATQAAKKKKTEKAPKPEIQLPPKPQLPGWGEDNHVPGNVTIKPVNKQLRDLVNEGKFEEAKALFNKMKTEGPMPNVVTYNIMVQMYRKAGDFKGVEETLKQRDESFRKKVTKGAATRTRLPRPYRPKPTSAPWALLVGLRRADKADPTVATVGILKEQLILEATPLVDKDISFVTPDDYNGFYSGWACMATLVEKGLVVRERHGIKGITYKLTDAGRKLADDLEQEWAEIQAKFQSEGSSQQPSSTDTATATA